MKTSDQPMRVADVSGLASLRRHFVEYGALAVIFEGILLPAGYFNGPFGGHPEFLLGGMLALLVSGALWTGRFSAARILTIALVVCNAALLTREAVAPVDPSHHTGSLIVGTMMFAASIYPAAVCMLPRIRAAAGSPYLRLLFTHDRMLTKAYAPGGAGWIGRLRQIRPLPAAVYLVIQAAVVLVAIVIQAASKGSRSSGTRLAKTVVYGLAGGIWVWAKRRSALRGEDLRNLDERPPVLLLRSFDDDMMVIREGARGSRADDLHRKGMTFERMLTEQLSPFGPCVAIGRPGEPLAPLGAARDYVPDPVWRTEVEQRMRDAVIVVLIVGQSPGLAWELRRLGTLGQLHKVILVFPPSNDLSVRWQTLLARDSEIGERILPEGVRSERTLALIYADDLTPIVLEGWRDERSYETAMRIAGVLAITTGEEPTAPSRRT